MGRRGRRLRPGGTVGVPAPGWSSRDRSDVLRSVAWWERAGYRVKLSDRVRTGRQGYGREDARRRAAEVTEMFADPEVEVIQCYEAGYGSARLLPHLDFETVRENPKPFVGYSDITALHLALRHFADLVTFYGPLFVTVGRPGKEATTEAMLRALTDPRPLGEVSGVPGGPEVRSLGSGSASGEVVGGCLWPIVQSIGTPWQPDLRGKVLFFEDLGKAPYLVDEQLTQMRHAGMLEGVKAVAVGEMVACDWRTAPGGWPRLMSLEDVLEEHLGSLGVPVVFGLPVGHGQHLVTIPLGARATIDADRRTLTFDEPALDP